MVQSSANGSSQHAAEAITRCLPVNGHLLHDLFSVNPGGGAEHMIDTGLSDAGSVQIVHRPGHCGRSRTHLHLKLFGWGPKGREFKSRRPDYPRFLRVG